MFFSCKFEDNYILNLIELLQNQFTNKKTFAIIFVKQFMELYNNFEDKQKQNGLSSLKIVFPKFLKILLNEIFLLDDYLEIVNYCNFPVFEGTKEALAFSYFIDFIQLKPVVDFSVLLKFIKEMVKDLGVLQPLFRMWLEVSNRFLPKLSDVKPKNYPLNLFLQFKVEPKSIMVLF